MAPLIYGIYREKELSPGKVEADAAILEEVLQGLAARGCEVRYLSASDLPSEPPRATGILHLAQGPEALGRLSLWERAGLPLINSPQAVLRCYRRNLFPLLAPAGVPYPATRFFTLKETRGRWPREFSGPGWLKRPEVHAEVPGDVVQVRTLAEAQAALGDFTRRRFDGLVWQEHVPGEEIKFYAVGPGRFFQAFWSATGEPVNGPLINPLKALAGRAARLIGLEVFGGDVIQTPEGPLMLIDLNDWPSFSRCRKAAAQEIARHVECLWTL
jgi:hypothetical protein